MYWLSFSNGSLCEIGIVRCKVYAKVFINGIEALRTSTKELNANLFYDGEHTNDMVGENTVRSERISKTSTSISKIKFEIWNENQGDQMVYSCERIIGDILNSTNVKIEQGQNRLEFKIVWDDELI